MKRTGLLIIGGAALACVVGVAMRTRWTEDEVLHERIDDVHARADELEAQAAHTRRRWAARTDDNEARIAEIERRLAGDIFTLVVPQTPTEQDEKDEREG